MRLVSTIVRSVTRIPVAVAALIQGAAFVFLTALCGAAIGALLGRVAGDIPRGALWGLGVGGFLATAGFSSSLDDVVSPGYFLDWWFHSAFLSEVAFGLTVLSYFGAAHFVPSNPWVCGAIALCFGLPSSFAVIGHLFPQASPYRDSVAAPLSTFREAIAKANLLARMKHGPAATRRARHSAAWANFKHRMEKIRRHLYERR